MKSGFWKTLYILYLVLLVLLFWRCQSLEFVGIGYYKQKDSKQWNFHQLQKLMLISKWRCCLHEPSWKTDLKLLIYWVLYVQIYNQRQQPLGEIGNLGDAPIKNKIGVQGGLNVLLRYKRLSRDELKNNNLIHLKRKTFLLDIETMFKK